MKKFLFSILLSLAVNLFAGQVFYVVPDGAGNKDGTSWANAFDDVQTAIDAAAAVAANENPSEVWIAAGTYMHGSAMKMKNNVEIYGGFAGTETTKEERIAGQNITYLDGENKYRVFCNEYSEENPLTNSAKLDNVVIQNGNALDGGGIKNEYASPEIINCTFVKNKTTSEGGGMYNLYASPKITNCTFNNNTSKNGGGISISGYGNDYTSSPEITNCTFINNQVSDSGGAIFNNVKTCSKITNCTFIGNNRNVFVWSGSSPILTNCILWGNGVYQITGWDGKPIVDTCIIQGGYSGGTNIITADPKLGELGDYGGNVPTIPVLAGSSAIGAGKVVEGVETDARGVARSTTAPTIGAYEVANPAITEQPQNKNFWLGKNAYLTISATTTHGSLSYQWQKYENEDWVNLEGETETTLNFPNITEELNGSKYRCVVSSTIDGGYTISDEATLTLVPDATQATLSANRITIVSGGYGSLSVESDAVEPTYQWYYSTNTGIDWTAIEGATNSSIDFAVDSSMNRRQFKCVVTDGGGTSVESNKAVLIINSSAITISQDIVDELAYIGRESVFTVSAASSSELSYQWQVSTDGGENYQDIEDATANTLALTPTDYSLSGNIYRLKIDNGGGYIYSNAATFTVFKNAAIVKQPADLIVWNAKNAQFTVVATGDGTLVYQWQIKNGDDWDNLEGATQSTLTLESVSTAMDGNKYRCIVENGGSASEISDAATLTVYKTLSITVQPQSAHTFAGDDALFSVEVDAQGEVSYQWQEFIDDTWVDIEAATSSDFTVETMEAAFDGRKFRVVITNGGDTFISDAAYLRLALPIEITSQPAIIPTAYIGGTAKFTVEVSGYAPQYQWYVAGNYGADIGVEIPGATAKTLTVSVESEDILENVYFCKITNAKSEVSTELVYIENVEAPTPYQAWAIVNGLSGDDALPTATPRNDGITNLEKFAFGLDGAKPASYADSPYFAQSVEGGNMALCYPISVDAEGAVNVKALMSTDLINWVETSATQTGTSQDGKFKLYKATAEIPEGGKVFLKLKVDE